MMLPSRRYLLAGGTIPLRCRYTIILRSPHSGVPAGGRAHAEIKTSARQSRNRNRRKRASEDSLAPTKASELTHEDRRGALFVSNSPTVSPMVVAPPDSTMTSTPPQKGTAPMGSVAQMHDLLQQESVAGRTSGAPAFAEVERIERRRSKPSVFDAEMHVGITERLFPEIRRLDALHELHYGDSVAREIDATVYFENRSISSNGVEPLGKTQDTSDGAAPLLSTGETDDAPLLEFSLDDDRFAAFEAESAVTTETVIAGPEGMKASQGTSALTDLSVKSVDGEAGEDVEDDVLPLVNPHGCGTPWFVPISGEVHLPALDPHDCVTLLDYLLYLRRQRRDDLPAGLRASIAAAVGESGKDPEPSPSSKGKKPAQPLQWAQVMSYLATAPAAVLGFTESLHPRGAYRSSGWVFVLYTENVSLQNAIGHLAALFELPQKVFHTRTNASKMSCAAQLCVLEPNCLGKEHLLLLNTMRHPGFVLRVGMIREVPEDKKMEEVVGDLARWQPLYRTEMLLRRVSGSSIKEIEHRLKCVRDVGSIFFCANREASLARAATDLFHGYYKSALLNALHRPKPPLAMRHFLLRPNVITASRARRAVTDSTIRQVLKVFLQTNGNWKTTVQRVPYPWRRRWLSALRSSVWNAMASKRIKEGGREVLIGDVVLRPEYRSDANHRLLSSVKEEHLKLVETAEEARMVTLEDVFIPFLRGIHPTNLFAPESSSHPIQTRSSMTAMLQSMHAMDLLTGLSPEMRDLLDVRSSKSPMVFRRLLMRPLHLEYDILEDKAPWKSTHFDAARILRNDRWEHAASASTSSTPCGTSSLVAQSEVLERTSIGAQLSRGVLAEEFFRLPSREDYAVLGQSKRNLHGNLSASEPLTPDGEMGERLYTVHLRAVVRNSVAGLNQILREYFVLGGIEQESDSALQHKVHRVRRELDPETSLLTAPSYCTACYCHDHDNVDACAEYRFKQGRINGARLREESLYASLDVTAENQASGKGVDTSAPALADGSAEVAVQPSELRLQLTLALRRANAESKWGVHLTNRLHLTGLESLDVLDVRGSSVSIQAPSCDEELAPVMTQMNALRSHVEMLCTTNQTDPSLPVSPLDSLSSLLATLCDNKADEARARLQGAVQILNNGAEKALLEFHSPSSWSSLVEKGNTPWRRCKWTLSAVNTERVQDKKGVAAAFVRLSKERQVKLLFEMVLHEDLPKPASLSNDNSNLVSSVPSTPALDFVPYHANRKLAKAHAELIAQCSADARKWLRELPTNLTMVLTKAVTHYTPSTSWGIQVCATDMTLTNFSIMLSEYRKTVPPTSEIATVYSISPESCFPRTGTNTWMTDVVIGELPRMMEVLNHLYNVRSINGRRVFTKNDAVQAIRRFEDQVGQSGLQENEQGRINLPITLQLSPETYGLLQRATADGVVTSSLPAPAADTQPTNCTQEAAASGKEDSTSHPAVFAPDQQKLLTEAQQLSQVVTIAINRRIVNERTAGKWGVQVEARTRRLKHLQHNHSFSMQVFASKRSQVVRISDALKHVSEEKRDKASAEGENAGTFFSNYVYCIEAVNSDSISDYTELKSALNRAALPTSAGGSSIHGEASTVTPESVTLRVRQYALARLAIVVRRGGPGEVSALSPVGLNVNQHLCVRAITPDSPMAKSVELATGAHCSLRCFLRDEPKDEDGRRVTVDCLPRNVLDAFIDCFPSMEDRLQTNAKTGSRKARPGTSKWKYQLDEDAMGGGAEASVSSMEEQHSHFERQASDFIGDCGIHSMIDAVPFLQVMYMLEFYHRFHSVSHPDGGSKVAPTMEDEDELVQKLARVHRQVQWRVTYASRSGITLRSPSDLAKVFAPGVAEETVYIQQCVDE